jgi:hypothetical protein
MLYQRLLATLLAVTTGVSTIVANTSSSYATPNPAQVRKTGQWLKNAVRQAKRGVNRSSSLTPNPTQVKGQWRNKAGEQTAQLINGAAGNVLGAYVYDNHVKSKSSQERQYQRQQPFPRQQLQLRQPFPRQQLRLRQPFPRQQYQQTIPFQRR